MVLPGAGDVNRNGYDNGLSNCKVIDGVGKLAAIHQRLKGILAIRPEGQSSIAVDGINRRAVTSCNGAADFAHISAIVGSPSGNSHRRIAVRISIRHT